MRNPQMWLSVVVGFAAASTPEGLAFLEKNGKEPGVMTLASGMQYKVLRAGSGDAHPLVSTPCECHYEGTLIDGTKFDSSYDRGSPTTFAPNQVIKGWTEAMQLMVEGDKWELFIPSELAYGDRGSPPKIPGGSVLKFIIEIVKIKGDTKPAARCNAGSLDKCDDQEKAYIDKMKAKGAEAINAELKRLQAMDLKKTKPELLVWLTKRKAILTQLASTPEL